MVITFEGNEGSGKSTAIKTVSGFLSSKGIKNVILREPGSNKIAEQIRSIILDKENVDLDPLTEMLLYVAARRQNIVETIKPELKKGNVVLIDRFYDSTYAYQVAGRGLSKEFCDVLHKNIMEDFNVDFTFYFDIPYQDGLARIAKNKRETNRMDEQTQEFYSKVEKGYLERVKNDLSRFEVINARCTQDCVAEQCIFYISRIFNLI